MPPSSNPIRERNVILLIALIQFVNILDFMMVMPLGPDFARALSIPSSDIGLIGGAYTFAAAIAGLLAGPFLDQFARKRAVLFSLGGLIIATLAGALVWDKYSMIAARILAGIFGGQMFALSQAMIADFIPPERRGAAMGKVAGGFAMASLIGVPFGLELASRFTWQAPFISTAILGAVVWIFALLKLPYHAPFGSDKPLSARVKHLWIMLSSKMPLMSYGTMGFSMMAGFMIIPNLSAHLQMNLGYPRSQLGILYFCGGALSFFGMRIAGRLLDKTSATLVVSIFTGILIFAMFSGFVWPHHPIPPIVFFVLFMIGMSGRSVCATTLSSKVPAPSDRGAYMSLQATVTHLSSAIGAYYSSRILVEENSQLQHVETLGLTAIAISLFVPFLIYRVEQALQRRNAPTIDMPPAVEAL